MITPQEKNNKLKKTLKLKADLYIKREDKHPLGSHKGRSLPIMVAYHIKSGWRNFVISSSGNAAIAAAQSIKKYNKKTKNKLTLTIFIGKKIDLEKKKIIKKLLDKNIFLKQTNNPKQQAFQMEKNKMAKNLRQSTDNSSLIGYEQLAKELATIKNLSAVFIPTSSGTTAEGLYRGFKKLKINPQIHIVQTDACHPLADAMEQKIRPTVKTLSLASAIVDKIAHRTKTVTEAAKKSRGNAWVVNNKEIKEALKIYKKTNQKDSPSPNSILSLAGLIQADHKKWPLGETIVCLFTGK
ncbi:MAG: hypothetical protein COU29_03795 [Candidatus Magasanikbacteria bacterium CG10_big_fil_rev_8_21_14_0_10_36_32]|uniref:Tryptophan synthase beta chain-like PALP domain-containing protein n=1 Tax=Candidatus Magasanikbacteria bacterium CG10_big_fil_rev_8_21_14_0_10_36_32 TaxID=1974646 RepID=A0A2M6W5L8_9BACT|nr:MAG: hypothetical protein COU29_03795 [Candidatus Magasanikbacteria bacterium CG10_big_fil_rev_8_21_14_0_10_36_32]